MPFERISVDHRIMGGVRCIRGTRIPVATVVGMVADGMTTDEILADFPQLSAEDIQDALHCGVSWSHGHPPSAARP